MNKVISAIVFLAAMIAWKPTYAGTCPGTRLIGDERDERVPDRPLGWMVLVIIPNGGPGVTTFLEVLAANGVRTGRVNVNCTGNVLTMQQQHGSMLFQGKPDANECNYNLNLTADPFVPGWYVHGTYTCTNGLHYFDGRLDTP